MRYPVYCSIFVLLLATSGSEAFFPSWKHHLSFLAHQENYAPVPQKEPVQREESHRPGPLAFQPSLAFSPLWVVRSQDFMFEKK
ncbi:hypothetical protein QR680_016387 [Steinernema hermaphroditum]|uniref:Uncharacterized protein n=1 Tax=Steinernema hermaphroditum TaxID=289476 RepID=A0AA39LMH6_9BILA|nr:hypothetical protein QR680_016387 [Steinernema hermaphroditum]